jgi:predicted alpha/beta-fold hydrolase
MLIVIPFLILLSADEPNTPANALVDFSRFSKAIDADLSRTGGRRGTRSGRDHEIIVSLLMPASAAAWIPLRPEETAPVRR